MGSLFCQILFLHLLRWSCDYCPYVFWCNELHLLISKCWTNLASLVGNTLGHGTLYLRWLLPWLSADNQETHSVFPTWGYSVAQPLDQLHCPWSMISSYQSIRGITWNVDSLLPCPHFAISGSVLEATGVGSGLFSLFYCIQPSESPTCSESTVNSQNTPFFTHFTEKLFIHFLGLLLQSSLESSLLYSAIFPIIFILLLDCSCWFHTVHP